MDYAMAASITLVFPGRFEAGTPAIAQAVGLGTACDYLSAIGMERVEQGGHQNPPPLFLNRRRSFFLKKNVH